MHAIHIQYHPTRIGDFILGAFDNKLCLLDFRYRKLRAVVDQRIKKGKGLQARWVEAPNATIAEAKRQLDDYLCGARTTFDLPIMMVGSPFQQKVWRTLQEVPYGTTASYLDIARRIGDPKAVRAVAGANGANALALIIPCHRIIGSDGRLTGYGGGLAVKKRLLAMEKCYTAREW
jgi:methylated-DNA-[protein]-cysteine S-methyltransferase